MIIHFDSEDEEALSELIARLRGKHDTRDLGEDISVHAFLVEGALSSMVGLMEKEMEKEENGEATWIGEEEGRAEHLLAAAQYMNAAAVALCQAVSPIEEEESSEQRTSDG